VGLLAVIGSTAALSNSTLADAKLFGMTFFDLFDYATSNILLPLGGLFICIFVGWVWGPDKIIAALSNNGALKNHFIVKTFFFIVRFVSPVLIFLIMLNGLKIIN
jgi:neurotransmitter:Na+ symporter, NSS family